MTFNELIKVYGYLINNVAGLTGQQAAEYVAITEKLGVYLTELDKAQKEEAAKATKEEKPAEAKAKKSK